MDDKFIRVSNYVKEKLEDIRKAEEHKTMDSVIRSLIKIYEVEMEKKQTGCSFEKGG